MIIDISTTNLEAVSFVPVDSHLESRKIEDRWLHVPAVPAAAGARLTAVGISPPVFKLSILTAASESGPKLCRSRVCNHTRAIGDFS